MSTDQTQKYSVLYVDPPWSYKRNVGRGIAADKYPTMSLKELKALDVPGITAKDAALAMWVTGPMLGDALELIKAWGFTYKTIGFCWVKTNKAATGFAIGLGAYTRSNVELVLLATKGKVINRESRSVRQLLIDVPSTPESVFAPRGEHSAKPPEVRARLEELFGKVPRVELFARGKIPNWDTWGYDAVEPVDLFDELAKHTEEEFREKYPITSAIIDNPNQTVWEAVEPYDTPGYADENAPDQWVPDF